MYERKIRSVLQMSCVLMAACGDGSGRPALGESGGGETVTMDGGGAGRAEPLDGGGASPTDTDGRAIRSTDAAVTSSLDCSKSSTFCVESHGTYEGKPFACAVDAGAGVLTQPVFRGSRILLQLYDCAPWTEVIIPVEVPGPFDYEFTSGLLSEVRVGVTRLDASGLQQTGDLADNFVGAHAFGTLTPKGTIRGAVTAAWAKPAPNCAAATPDEACREASFTMTFNVPVP